MKTLKAILGSKEIHVVQMHICLMETIFGQEEFMIMNIFRSICCNFYSQTLYVPFGMHFNRFLGNYVWTFFVPFEFFCSFFHPANYKTKIRVSYRIMWVTRGKKVKRSQIMDQACSQFQLSKIIPIFHTPCKKSCVKGRLSCSISLQLLLQERFFVL